MVDETGGATLNPISDQTTVIDGATGTLETDGNTLLDGIDMTAEMQMAETTMKMQRAFTVFNMAFNTAMKFEEELNKIAEKIAQIKV